MIFTLIKNELIKISKRSKTWIVFALFAICVVGIGIISNIDAKQIAYNNTPEGRIESLNSSIQYAEDHLKELETYKDKWAEEAIEEQKQHIVSLKEEIKLQEERKKNPNDPNLWRKTLEQEKKNIQEVLDDESYPDRYKTYEKQRMAEINSFLDAGIKPVEEWEFYPTNVGMQFMQVVGLIILAAGIAVFMSDIVSGESTPATLKFLLVQPISRAKVILSKFIAVVITVVGMIAGLEVAAYGVIGAFTGFDAAKMPKLIGMKFQWDYSEIEKYGAPQLSQVDGSGILSTRGDALFQGFALQILFIIACCALIFMISTLVKSSMISMAISVLVCVASTMICMMSPSVASKFGHLIFLNYGNTVSVIDGSIAQMFNNPNFSIGFGVALMVGTIVVCYTISTVIFNKKDILA